MTKYACSSYSIIFGEIVQTRFGRLNIGENHMHGGAHIIIIYQCKNIIGEFNVGVLFKNHPSPKFTISYTIYFKVTHSHDLIEQSISDNLVVG